MLNGVRWMNSVVWVGTIGSGEYTPHLKRGLLHSHRLLPGRPSEADSSDFPREPRNMGFNVKVPQILSIWHYFKKMFNMWGPTQSMSVTRFNPFGSPVWDLWYRVCSSCKPLQPKKKLHVSAKDGWDLSINPSSVLTAWHFWKEVFINKTFHSYSPCSMWEQRRCENSRHTG